MELRFFVCAVALTPQVHVFVSVIPIMTTVLQLQHATDITLVTQCSLDRIFQLEEQCTHWAGVTSVAVFVPLQIPLPEAENQLRDLFVRVEAQGSCRLDIAVVRDNEVSYTCQCPQLAYIL